MAETLGMLCDKLTIVKLKQYHTEDAVRLDSLGKQQAMLQTEIDEFVSNAITGIIPIEKLSFAANKVFFVGHFHLLCICDSPRRELTLVHWVTVLIYS